MRRRLVFQEFNTAHGRCDLLCAARIEAFASQSRNVPDAETFMTLDVSVAFVYGDKGRDTCSELRDEDARTSKELVGLYDTEVRQ